MEHKERTKCMLADKLKEISQSKALKSITVQSLASACGINRGTFYYHFRDIQDLINWIYHVEVTIPAHEYIRSCDTDFNGISKVVLQNVYKNRDFFRQAIQLDGQNNLSDYMLSETILNWELLRDKMLEKKSLDFKKLDPALQKDIDIVIKYFCFGHYFASRQWMLDGMKTSPEYFSFMLDEAGRSGLFNVLEKLIQNDSTFLA